MYDIDVEHNIVIESNYDINYNQVFNKIKPNLKDFDHENQLNNCVKQEVRKKKIISWNLLSDLLYHGLEWKLSERKKYTPMDHVHRCFGRN